MRIAISSALIFVLTWSVALASEDDYPLFSIDPTPARVSVLKDFPVSCGSCWFQAGKAVKETEIDRNLPSCEMRTDNRDIYYGRRYRVRSIEGVERIIRDGKRAYGWLTRIYLGVHPDLEGSIECHAPRGQRHELTVVQLKEVFRDLLAFSDYEVLPFKLSRENTFSALPPNVAFRFNADVDTSMTDGRHILFQNGRVAKPWQAGPHCYSSGASWGHRIESGTRLTLRNLSFAYFHSAGLRINTSTSYSVTFQEKIPGMSQFICMSDWQQKPMSSYRRPTLDEFQRSVGELITLE